LESAKLASGTAAVIIENVDLADLLSTVKDDYAQQVKDSVTFNWEFSANLPEMATDGGKLRQILKNLINNAVKFTESGSITISARLAEEREAYLVSRISSDRPKPDTWHLTPDTNEEPRATNNEIRDTNNEIRTTSNEPRDTNNELRATRFVEFSVADTGIGITSEAVPLIFEKFRQGDSSDTRSYEGAGLGLFIVKKFSELLGGEVHVESEPGRGSTFTVTLPSEPCHAAGQNGVDTTAAGARNGQPSASSMLERLLP
jgi:signal transduction histidine kinase